MNIYVRLAGFAMLAASTAASAQDMNLMMTMHDQCQADVQKICSAVPQNPNAIVGCLATNKDKLTQGCRDVTEKVLLAMPGLAPTATEAAAATTATTAAPAVTAEAAAPVAAPAAVPATTTATKKKRKTKHAKK
jgi:Cysteine rich repeat